MHELSLAQAIWQQTVDQIHQHAACRLKSLSVVVGAFSGADPESLEFVLRLLAGESAWPEAEVYIRVEPIGLKCRVCGHEYQTEILDLACPVCGGYDVDVTSGRDLRLESLEVSVDDDEKDPSGEKGALGE